MFVVVPKIKIELDHFPLTKTKQQTKTLSLLTPHTQNDLLNILTTINKFHLHRYNGNQINGNGTIFGNGKYIRQFLQNNGIHICMTKCIPTYICGGTLIIQILRCAIL